MKSLCADAARFALKKGKTGLLVPALVISSTFQGASLQGPGERLSRRFSRFSRQTGYFSRRTLLVSRHCSTFSCLTVCFTPFRHAFTPYIPGFAPGTVSFLRWLIWSSSPFIGKPKFSLYPPYLPLQKNCSNFET